MVSTKNISVQCLLSYRKRTLLGKPNRYLIIVNPTTIWCNPTSTWELLRQSSAGILKLGIHTFIKYAYRDYLFLGIINSFLFNNQNFTSQSHSFRLDFHLGVTVYKKEAIIDSVNSLFFINGRAIRCKSSQNSISFRFPVGFPLLSLTRTFGKPAFLVVSSDIMTLYIRVKK